MTVVRLASANQYYLYIHDENENKTQTKYHVDGKSCLFVQHQNKSITCIFMTKTKLQIQYHVDGKGCIFACFFSIRLSLLQVFSLSKISSKASCWRKRVYWIGCMSGHLDYHRKCDKSLIGSENYAPQQGINDHP